MANDIGIRTTLNLSFEQAIQKTTESYQLKALGQGLAAVAGKLGVTQAAAVVSTYVEAIQKSTNYEQLDALGQGLAAVAGKLGDTQAASIVPLLLDAIWVMAFTSGSSLLRISCPTRVRLAAA